MTLSADQRQMDSIISRTSDDGVFRDDSGEASRIFVERLSRTDVQDCRGRKRAILDVAGRFRAIPPERLNDLRVEQQSIGRWVLECPIPVRLSAYIIALKRKFDSKAQIA